MDFTALKERLEQNNFTVTTFATGAEAARYLNEVVDGKTVGFGGSMTLKELGLYESLSAHNEVHWHWVNGPEEREKAMATQVYMASVNAIAADEGALLNIDGTGNRVAGTLFGHEKVYFVVGRNKIAPTFEEALWRAKNIAAPKNTQRLNMKVPCAVHADKCYECNSPARGCNSLVVHWKKMNLMEMDIVLIDEELGY